PAGDAASLAAPVRNAIWSVDKDLPVVRVATMENLLAQTEAQRRFALIIFEAFALVALVLAATGIYGVLSGSVTERTREIGIRAALGASRSDILTLIVRQGMTLTVLGVVIGIIGAVAASRTLITLLFGISRLDAITSRCNRAARRRFANCLWCAGLARVARGSFNYAESRITPSPASERARCE